ncbi:hypothetical protein ACL7TT_18235 [Microbulbifer sp. 2304DJ12-6]|uniref:hypothetical protein n=1 Tax=Microbulbifer sp. 2304DJ12-6 TaxID=3233340 RepID=UPI0039B0AF40
MGKLQQRMGQYRLLTTRGSLSDTVTREQDESGVASLPAVRPQGLFRKNCHVFAYAVFNSHHIHRRYLYAGSQYRITLGGSIINKKLLE